ncbi:MAG: potassium-transporting ATPase subunit KdpA [bacterium]|nr:potassium-transporting ATPase subunit KdpA [bacterium]
MSTFDWLQIFLFITVLVALTPPLGMFMARVYEGKRTWLTPALGWFERITYRLSCIQSKQEMSWKEYSRAWLWFNLLGFLIVFLLQSFQSALPLNPQKLPNTSWHLAFNTAASFMTNTNWQSYAGETTLSYLTQMLGLTVQNFVSAASGLAVFVALARGLARSTASTIGNFWVDLVRSVLYILLPLSLILAIFLVGQGVVQTFTPYHTVKTLEGVEQVIPLGPAASQIAIKQLGTNGGGFFNANSAHPLENPTPISNFLEMLAILLIGATQVYAFGILSKCRRHAWVLFSVMLFFWGVGLGASLLGEYTHNATMGITPLLEGKEARFGVVNSLIWSNSTTDASNGSVNAMHSSLSPLVGGIALFNMHLGEIVFGGVGVGLTGMIVFAILTVFLSGLMVGRTPEYLGKKVEAWEMKMAIIAVLVPSICMLVGTGIACVLPAGLSSLANKGPHGFSEMLYAFTSAGANNGSAFAGLSANTPFYNVSLGIIMLLSRAAAIFPILAIAGSMAAKKITPPSVGTFSTDTLVFAILLIAVIVIVGALNFFPALTLGPIVEHMLMMAGRSF